MSTYVARALQQKVRKQFHNCCAYCHTSESLTATTFEIEHITPVSAGGQTTADNLCLACPTCNRYKAAKQTAEDPETSEEATLFNPQQQSWPDHFAWNLEMTEIVGLTPTGRATSKLLRMNRLQLVRVRKLWIKLGEHPPSI